MRKSAARYVTLIAAMAAISIAVVYLRVPGDRGTHTTAIALLCALAVTADLLSFVIISGTVRGSISFIPYLAAVLVVPYPEAVYAIVGVQVASEFLARRHPGKGLFNVAAHAISGSLALLSYTALGGVSLMTLSTIGIYQATMRVGIAVIAAVFAYFLSNGLLMTGLLSIDMQRPYRPLLRELLLPSIGFNFLAAPIIFLFSWIFVAYGPFAAAVVWVPILGLRQVHKAKTDLERTNRELLELLVKSIEARDPYTSGHSRRVQRYSLLIARALGLKDRETEHVGQAALLHDVGKIYEKYAPILAKADKLTPDEWATMQEHPLDGANLVAMMSNLRDIVPAIRHHHEKWDGSGYPDGLAGDSIPLASRIITFADTIDAMTSERPYRRPLSAEQVRAEILRCRERQFDPEITDRLLASPAWASLFSPQQRDSAPIKNLRIVRTGEVKVGAS